MRVSAWSVARTWQLATMRRGVARTFFSSNKRWFGAPPATSAQDRSALKAAGYGPSGYPHEGIEAQSRRLADLAFMLGDYELAGQTYQAIRREYQNDKAWKYMAAAQEMAGLCLHYVEPGRRDADPYLEQAGQTYQQVMYMGGGGGLETRAVRSNPPTLPCDLCSGATRRTWPSARGCCSPTSTLRAASTETPPRHTSA
jgi:hypothetical protein